MPLTAKQRRAEMRKEAAWLARVEKKSWADIAYLMGLADEMEAKKLLGEWAKGRVDVPVKDAVSA